MQQRQPPLSQLQMVSFSAGGAVGTLFIIWSAEGLGRKKSIQIGALFAVLGGVLQGGAATLG